MVRPCGGMVQTSILLVEWHVFPNCELPPVYPIPIGVLLQTHQTSLQRRILLIKIASLPDGHLKRLELTPIGQ